MESLFHIKCHRILDQQKEEREAVVVVVYLAKGICSAVYIELKVLKILMFVTSGDQDILKDNVQIFSIIIVKF
tara:strand:+ start:645 stop:863 length:219 start_codon:yes stop_codon:yes gene_type:complete